MGNGVLGDWGMGIVYSRSVKEGWDGEGEGIVTWSAELDDTLRSVLSSLHHGRDGGEGDGGMGLKPAMFT